MTFARCGLLLRSLTSILPSLIGLSSDAPAQEILMEIAGQTPGNGFGVGLDAADLNGDGVHDFVVGLSNDGTTFDGAGAVQVFDGATQALLFQVFGVKKKEGLGTTVVALGDVDLDGFPDVAGGAPSFDASTQLPNVGRIVVVSSASGAVLTEVVGTTPGGWLAWGMVPAADSDGDGRDDVIATSPFEAGVGAVRVFSGASGSQLGYGFGDGPQTPFGSIHGPVARFDDLDNDGAADIAVTGEGPLGYRVYSSMTGAVLSEAQPTQYVYPSVAKSTGAFGRRSAGGELIRANAPQAASVRASSSSSNSFRMPSLPAMVSVSFL